MYTQTVARLRRSSRFALGLALAMFGPASSARAQWLQWGQNGAHSSFLADVPSQPPNQVAWQYQFDLNPPLGEIFIHYGVPLVLDDSDDGSIVIARRHDIGGRQASYDVVKLDSAGNVLWGPIPSDYRYPNHNWEPNFQTLYANGLIYYAGAGGVLHSVSVDDGTPGPDIISDATQGIDPSLLVSTVFVAGVPTADASGNVYFTIRTQAGPPPGVRDQVVKAAPDGSVMHADFADLAASPAVAPLNAGAAIAGDGSLYVVIRTGGFPNDRLLGLNPDLSLRCSGSLDQVPGKQALVFDDSSSVPVVGPDGRVYYGGWNTNGVSRGYLYEFSPVCAFQGYYPFGWDDTPAIYQPDPADPTTYYLVEKDNHYENDEHVGPYYITALDPNIDPSITDDNLKIMNIVWQFQAPPGPAGNYEWCINQPAVDTNGTVLANSEDGFYYSISWGGGTYARQHLAAARDAAYTPLAMALNGAIYTLNSGILFKVTQ